MDTREKLIGARVGMVALADELKNISRALVPTGRQYQRRSSDPG